MQKARGSMEKENITRVQLTVAQWMQMRKDAPELVRDTPAWLTVTGCSMLPFVRPYRDRVMIRAWGIRGQVHEPLVSHLEQVGTTFP